MQPGTRLGPYEILSRIGAGGMGVVWRARDTRLGREVAIKILPAEFAQDAKLKIRFEREAQTISQLSHPNICTLFDVGENYLVMELLEGESLAERLTRGALPLPEVVRYGVQIAEALGKAHREGVVHRDLKPGNIMLTKSGAKLLDFGLAKSSVVAASSSDATVQKPLTEQGTVLGTFQYMAPEQLAGDEPDARTDIFALGAVLYEMATGKHAFEGKNRTSLIAAIVSGEPRAMRELQPLTPPSLEHVILKCLEKDSEDRWQSASDIAEELRWISQAGSQIGLAALVSRRRKWRDRTMVAAIAVLLAATVTQALFSYRGASEEEVSIESTLSMEPGGGIAYFSGPPAFSPDGKRLAFAGEDKHGRRMIWIRPLTGAAPQPLANTKGAASPFWSPDGRFVAFFADGKLKKIPSEGGDADIITGPVYNGSGTWNRDGVILYSWGALSPSIFRTTAFGGGEPTPVMSSKSVDAKFLSWPWFLPDGNHYLVHASSDASQEKRPQGAIWIATLDGKQPPRFLVRADSNAVWVEPGWLLFERDGLLRAQRLDGKTFRISGESSAITPVRSFAWKHCATFAASNSGLLAYQLPGRPRIAELQLRNLNGELLRALGRGSYWGVSLSRDGRRAAVQIDAESEPADIWIIGLGDGSESRLTFEPVDDCCPVWSPDGETIAYNHGDAMNDRGILAKGLGSVAETLVDLPGREEPTDWSRDGRYVAFGSFDGDIRKSWNLVVLSLDTRKRIDIAATAAFEHGGVFSPDSRWIAYQSDESGRSEIYVQPFPPTGAKYQISRSGGNTPRWPVANEIYYVGDDGRLTTVRVEMKNGLLADPPQSHALVIDESGNVVPSSDFDVTADGVVLVAPVDRNHPTPLTLVTNWTRRLQMAARR